MQITSKYRYLAFATYLILQNYPQLNKYGRYLNPCSNSEAGISKNYDEIVKAAQDLVIDISQYTRIVDEGADYVGSNFAWESAGYFWDTENNINEKIDGGITIDDVSIIINSGDGATFPSRKRYYDNLIDAYDNIF